MTAQTYLVTGGTGKTGGRLVGRLKEFGQSVRVASRTASGRDAAPFDWSRPETFGPTVEGVDAVYLVAPVGVLDPAPVMTEFAQIALAAGVRRFVLLSSSLLPEDGPAMGAVHGFLRRNTPEWCVLQPSWFMQNFSEGQHLPTIRDEGLIVSATGAGRVGFVDAADISEVALRALVDREAHNTAHLITGPEALSYDEAAEILSQVIGRPVRHQNLTPEALSSRWRDAGLEPGYADLLAELDRAISQGAEDRVSTAVLDVTGRPPVSFAAFASAHAGVWAGTASVSSRS